MHFLEQAYVEFVRKIKLAEQRNITREEFQDRSAVDQIVADAGYTPNEFVMTQVERYADCRLNNRGLTHEEAVYHTQSHMDGEPAYFISPWAADYNVLKEEYGGGGWKQIVGVLVETADGKQIQFNRSLYANGGTCRVGCWNAETVSQS